MAISKELLDILACPKCKGYIHLNETQDGLICDQCRLLYEIEDDIPIMLIDEAKHLRQADFRTSRMTVCMGSIPRVSRHSLRPFPLHHFL